MNHQSTHRTLYIRKPIHPGYLCIQDQTRPDRTRPQHTTPDHITKRPVFIWTNAPFTFMTTRPNWPTWPTWPLRLIKRIIKKIIQNPRYLPCLVCSMQQKRSCARHIFLLPVTHSSEEWNIETAMLSTPCLCCPFSHISSASGSVSNCSQCWIVSCLWLSLIILFLWSFIVFWFSSKVIFGKKGKRTPIKMRFLISLQVVLLSRQFISLQANNASQSGDPISKPLTNQNHHDWWLIYAFGSYSSQSAIMSQVY